MNKELKRLIADNLDLLEISGQTRTNIELLLNIVYERGVIEGLREATEIHKQVFDDEKIL